MRKINLRQHPLLICALLLVLVAFIGIGFFLASRNTINEQNQDTPIQNSGVTKVVSNTNPTPHQVSTFTYVGKIYQATYPTDWTEDANTLDTTQGTMLDLQPSASNGDEAPHVAVEVNNADDASFASMSAGLSFLGFKKITTTVGGVAAEKFSGTVTLSQKVLHNTIYLFSYNNQTYLIKLSYAGNNYNSQLEEEFTQFVNSFKFN